MKKPTAKRTASPEIITNLLRGGGYYENGCLSWVQTSLSDAIIYHDKDEFVETDNNLNRTISVYQYTLIHTNAERKTGA